MTSPTPILIDTAILSQIVDAILDEVDAPRSKKSACLNRVAARIAGTKHNWGYLTGHDGPITSLGVVTPQSDAASVIARAHPNSSTDRANRAAAQVAVNALLSSGPLSSENNPSQIPVSVEDLSEFVLSQVRMDAEVAHFMRRHAEAVQVDLDTGLVPPVSWQKVASLFDLVKTETGGDEAYRSRLKAHAKSVARDRLGAHAEALIAVAFP